MVVQEAVYSLSRREWDLMAEEEANTEPWELARGCDPHSLLMWIDSAHKASHCLVDRVGFLYVNELMVGLESMEVSMHAENETEGG